MSVPRLTSKMNRLLYEKSMKTDTDRLLDTKDYLSKILTSTQYLEINNKLQALPNQMALAAALAIGHSNPLNTAGRRAKRALKLLAYLLISDNALKNTELARIQNLPEGSEAPLIAEIRSWFTEPAANGTKVASDAVTSISKMPKWNNVNFDATDAVRGVYRVDKPFNCYNACVFWAFQSGAISKRYLWNKLQGKDGNTFFPTYSQVGWTTILKFRPDGSSEIDTTGTGPIIVPAGHTVYFETPAKVFGHVACSLGDGRVISQNSVNIGTSKLNALSSTIQPEFDKMANAITHIVSIRDMIAHYFNVANGYRSIQVTNGCFWDPIPAAER